MSEEIEKALVLQRKLRNIFDLHAGGRKDAKALQRVRGICTEVSGMVPDTFCKDRLARIENFADALFADRKHQQWTPENTENVHSQSVHSLRHSAYTALDEVDRRLHLTLVVLRKEAIRREGNTKS